MKILNWWKYVNYTVPQFTLLSTYVPRHPNITYNYMYQSVELKKYWKLKKASVCTLICIFWTKVVRYKVSTQWSTRPSLSAMTLISLNAFLCTRPWKLLPLKLKLYQNNPSYLLSFLINQLPIKGTSLQCTTNLSWQSASLFTPFWKVRFDFLTRGRGLQASIHLNL